MADVLCKGGGHRADAAGSVARRVDLAPWVSAPAQAVDAIIAISEAADVAGAAGPLAVCAAMRRS